MNESELRERINAFLVEEFELDPEDLTPDAQLYETLGLDSLDLIDLVVGMEKEFSLKIIRGEDEHRLRAVRTLADVYAFAQNKLEEESRPHDQEN